MNKLGFGAVLVLGLLCAQGCGKGSYSTPKATAKSMADAMARGDAAGVKAAVINADPQTIDVFVAAVSSSKAVSDAAQAKFGGDAKNAFSEDGLNIEDISKQLDNAEEKIDGDNATLTMKDGPLKLKKVNREWKIDFSQMPGITNMSAEDMKPLTAMVDVNKQMAADISAGKYATLKDATDARMQKILGAAMSGTPAPGKTP